MKHRKILKHLTHSFDLWFPLVITLTMVTMFVFIGVQFSARTGANDPQVQMADEVVQSLSKDIVPAIFMSEDTIAIESDLSPYIVVFDANRSPIMGNGLLNGELPTLPSGVFDRTLQAGESRFTWSPESGVRHASVLRHYQDERNILSGYVLSGRSLQEPEYRIAMFGYLTIFFWLLSVLVTVGMSIAVRRS